MKNTAFEDSWEVIGSKIKAVFILVGCFTLLTNVKEK